MRFDRKGAPLNEQGERLAPEAAAAAEGAGAFGRARARGRRRRGSFSVTRPRSWPLNALPKRAVCRWAGGRLRASAVRRSRRYNRSGSSRII